MENPVSDISLPDTGVGPNPVAGSPLTRDEVAPFSVLALPGSPSLSSGSSSTRTELGWAIPLSCTALRTRTRIVIGVGMNAITTKKQEAAILISRSFSRIDGSVVRNDWMTVVIAMEPGHHRVGELYRV